MKVKDYSVNIHWDKRYPKAGTDLCPIQIGINLNGLQFKMGLKLYANQIDFDKAMNSRGGNSDIKELRRQIHYYIDKAETILDRLKNPTREVFQRIFKSETDLFTTSKTDATFFFEQRIEECFKEDRIKTAQNLEHTLKSFKKYKTRLYLEDIDAVWLKGYKNWIVQQGNSVTTAQIYMRNLRTIFNLAIKEGYISERHYPFKTYSIGTTVKSKDVLYPEQIKALYEYTPRTYRERRAKAYWFFCYLANGMNFKDACYLKYKDIKGENIVFVREKTKNTNTVTDKTITVYLHPVLREIIENWGNKPRNPESYIFPVVNRCKTMLASEKKRKNHSRLTNRMLNQIGKTLGFEVRLNLNLARHSFATMLKISGTPTPFITDALGHSNSKTTEHYLKSIPDEKYKNISDKLLEF